MELVLLRRIYRVPELFQLLATFGVVLVVQDLVLKAWGPARHPGAARAGALHAVGILGHRFPAYELFLIAMGPLVLGLLWLLMHKTRFGVLVRAATQDREMVGRWASTRRCCSPARCSSARRSPGSAGRRRPSSPPIRTWTSR